MASLSPFYSECGPRTGNVSIIQTRVEMQNLRPYLDLLNQESAFTKIPE